MRAIKKFISVLVKYEFSWRILNSISKLGSFISYKRKEYEISKEKIQDDKNEKISNILADTLFRNKTVLHGPFKGMQYPELSAVGSELFPKLIGSYEKEIEGLIEMLCKIEYSEIIDVGCAEGYYAVGFAIRNPKARIFAYDNSEQARILCSKMTKLNHVEKRILIENECTPELLNNFPITKRGLIICDCEGYEKHLFDSSNVFNLKRCDILIEMHDFIDRNISLYLRQVFQKTHAMLAINSIDDKEKAINYYFDELSDVEVYTKKMIFKERRPEIMQWLFLTPIHSDNN